jgi:hypothetical protein
VAGIIIDIEAQYYRDRFKVAGLERGHRPAVNPMPIAWDSNYAEWKPGDNIGNAEAIRTHQGTAIYTIEKIEGGRVYFKRGTKLTDTDQANLVRLQERKA